MDIRCSEDLAPYTTLKLGGRAEYECIVQTTDELLEAMAWAERKQVPLTILGGGSNVVVADQGVRGLVARVALRGLTFSDISNDIVELTVAAGELWDDVVAAAVNRGLSGIECLSGIPGLTGATPIQNVGAYGQDVSQTIVRVDCLDRHTRKRISFSNDQCDFSYRDSLFKRNLNRYVVISVTFQLTRKKPLIHYAELAAAVASKTPEPSVRDVRETVLELRKCKSMIVDVMDPNHRSVGSFFMNPVINTSMFNTMVNNAVQQGIVYSVETIPKFMQPKGCIKVPAAWLIEKSGFSKGFTRSHVGISTHHALALVHHGNGTTQELIDLARTIQSKVQSVFGITLKPEPVFIGFETIPL